MGNLRSVEKALERVGARPELGADPARAATADGLILPGVGAFPAAMSASRRSGWAGSSPSGWRPARRYSGSASAFSCCSSSTTELGGARGLGLLDGTVAELDAPGLSCPHIGWEPVRWERECELSAGIEDGTPFYFVHGFAPAGRRTRRAARDRGPRRTLRLRDRPPAALRGAVPSGEVERRRPAPARQLRGDLRAGPGAERMILYPAIDIRGGRAVRLVQGDYDRETAYDADPVDAARRWVEQGARALHVVDLDGARDGRAGEHRSASSGSARRSTSPVQVGGGLRSAEDVAAVLAAGAERAILGTAALADPALVEALAAEHGERLVVAADARAGQGRGRGLGARLADRGGAARRDRSPARGVRRFIHTPVEVDGTLEGPSVSSLREVASSAADAGATAHLLGRDRDARGPRGDCGRAPRRGRGRDRRQGPLRGPVHGRRGHRGAHGRATRPGCGFLVLGPKSAV